MDLENHPIPQDVTGFQFKLIGDMTVKQFAFLAGASILAYIFYALPIFVLIRIPFAIITFFVGIFMAFIPISGRPANLMFLYFIKALFSQDQYIYKKQGGNLMALVNLPPPSSYPKTVKDKGKLESYLKTIKSPPLSNFDQKEEDFLNSIANIMVMPIPQAQPSQNTNIPNVQPLKNEDKNMFKDMDKTDLQEKINTINLNPQTQEAAQIISMDTAREKEQVKEEEKPKPAQGKEIELKEEEEEIKKELEEAKKEEKVDLSKEAHEKVLSLEDQLSEVTSQKQKLEEELIALQKKLEIQGKQVFQPSIQEEKKQTPNIRKVPNTQTKQTGIIAPDVPNVVSGIIKNPRGGLLPNILVEIVDPEGNPIRAFKTNQLGQFASATALPNGEFTIQIEDPSEKNKFDTIAITLNNQIIEPLEIISTDQREELRRSLFGENQ